MRKMAEETFELEQESPLEFSSNSITIDSKLSSTGTVILKNKSTQYRQNYEKSLSTIDDFRLYSYGLSETEVEELSKR